MPARLDLTRSEILAFRRRAGALEERLPWGRSSLRQAAWAGLQDSMPRAALLSIHARLEETKPTAVEDPALIQLWGPRYNAYVVAARDVAVFSLSRMPEDDKRRQIAEDLADRLADILGDEEMDGRSVGQALGIHPGAMRYAAPTGRVAMRWDGAHRPTVWMLPPPDITPAEARRELARRYLHVFGPSGPGSFAEWAGIKPKPAADTFASLESSLLPVRTPIGEAWILSSDEAELRRSPGPAAPARLLPSGDAFYLLQGDDRALLVPETDRRAALWTSRVWPGAVLVGGEIVGTWRRAGEKVTIQAWRGLPSADREEVEAEAAGLPLPGVEQVVVRWDD